MTPSNNASAEQVSKETLSEEKKMELILRKFHGHTREQWENELVKQYPFCEIPHLVDMVWEYAQSLHQGTAQGLKWVKASERLPDFTGHYKFRLSEFKTEATLFFNKKEEEFFKHSYKINELEWLDELSTCLPTPSAPSLSTAQGVRGIDALENFGYCQSEIEGRGLCKVQCEHCIEYFAPLEIERKKYFSKNGQRIFNRALKTCHEFYRNAATLPKQEAIGDGVEWDDVLTNVPVRVHPMTENYLKNKYSIQVKHL